MAKLPKHLIKKHGISKKAWAIFKKSKKGKSTRKTRSVKHVAKRKVSRSRKAKPKSTMQKIMGRVGTPLAAIAYGFARDKISDAIAMSKIGQQLPVTNFTDEASMLILAFGARKMGLAKNPIGGKLIRAAETIEWARIGEELSNQTQGGMGLGLGSKESPSAMTQATLVYGV